MTELGCVVEACTTGGAAADCYTLTSTLESIMLYVYQTDSADAGDTFKFGQAIFVIGRLGDRGKEKQKYNGKHEMKRK
jgi:hypothetical protein